MAEKEHEDNVYRYALYVGSFSVGEDDQRDKTNKVQRELEALRVHTKERRILLSISLKGIKICSVDRFTVFMAHALRRISYATCDATHRQFAFLAREPLDETNNQYCHVFITDTSAQAEELNRIVGDAFQLAYVQQLLLKKQIGHNTNCSNNNNTNISATNLAQPPRLRDRHAPWPQSAPVNGQRSILNVLQLPPPPACPPPSTQVINSVEGGNAHGAKNQTAQEVPASNPEFSPGSKTSQSVSPKPLDRATSPVSIFRRRAVLRRDQEARLSGIADAQILGGSTRQPKRRQGLGWTHLFSSARHSAFIPGTQKNQPPTSVDVLGLLNSKRSPTKTNIFVDLRTFAGGSPVVALKERLDAQAIADAKASAFAETAAVLAAAKQASSASSLNSSARQDSSSTPNASSSPDTSTSPCSTTSTHSEPGRLNCNANDVSSEIPPTPPLRLHSLRRQQNHIFQASPTQGSFQLGILNEQLNDADDSRGNASASGVHASISCAFQSDTPHDRSSTSNGQQTHIIPNQASQQWQGNASSQHVFVRDHRIHRQPARTIIESSSSSTQSPLHVTVSKCLNHCETLITSPFPAKPNIRPQLHDSSEMTASVLSAETPTPTATPTPTPSQTPLPLGTRTCAVWASPDDAEFLKQSPWYQAHLPREVAYELLAREEFGSFIVRNSISHPDCCALSVRVPLNENPTGITHYLIQRTARGVKLKGLEKTWPSLRALITHLTVIPEMLPCPLRLPQCVSNPVFLRAEIHASTSSNPRLSQNAMPPMSGECTNSSSVDHNWTRAIVQNGNHNEVTSIQPSEDVVKEVELENEVDDEEYQRLSDFSSIFADLDHPPSNNQSLTSCS